MSYQYDDWKGVKAGGGKQLTKKEIEQLKKRGKELFKLADERRARILKKNPRATLG